MSANPQWTVTLARSSDLSELGLLSYAFTLSPIFNRPGSFSMTMPLDDEIAYRVVKHASSVICERNGTVRWSGPIVSVVKDAAAMTMSISALGWLDELSHRFVRVDEESMLNFVDISGGTIVQALVASANSQLDTDGNPRPTHLGFSNANDTQIRTRSYKRGQNYGQAIQELSDIENGLDLYVDPRSRLITTKAPTSYVNRTRVMFGYGMEPFNLANATQNDDGSTTANRISAVGSNGIIVAADDQTAMDAQGFMREDWLSVSDVASPTIIGAYANAELVYRRWGQVTYELSPQRYGDIPRLWDDFDLGDQVYVSVDAGALEVERQAVRVFSVSLEVDAQGNEAITQIGTAPQQ